MRQLSRSIRPRLNCASVLRDASDPSSDGWKATPWRCSVGTARTGHIATGDKEIVYTGLTPKLVDRLLKAKFVIAGRQGAAAHARGLGTHPA